MNTNSLIHDISGEGVFESLPSDTQGLLQEIEELNETFEEWMPATLSPKLIEKGVKHRVKLWSVPRSTGELLYALVKEYEPRMILELGTSAGYSTLWMALAAKEYGGKIVSVDSSERKLELAGEFLQRAGDDIAQSVELVEASIADFLQSWEYVRASERIDFLFIDADKKNTARFYEVVYPHFAPAHTIVVDDAVKYAVAMEDFLMQIQSHPDYTSRIVEQDHGVMIARHE